MKEILLAVLVIILGAAAGRALSYMREREFERIEKRLRDAEYNYPAAHLSLIRSEIGWRNF